jgi:hypothetical protein
MALVLYGFAFLDAYFTAREVNAATGPHIHPNPRVAAVLNLVTRGFGYWYVGERKKAAIVFVLVWVAGRAALTVPNELLANSLSIGLEFALAFLAFDAYRIAQREVKGILEVVPHPAAAIRPEAGLPAAVPLAMAGLIVAGYVGFVTLGLLLPSYNPVDQSQASVTEQQDGKRYANPKYGVQLTVPQDWQLETTDASSFLTASKQGAFCQAGLLAESVLPGAGIEGYVGVLASQLSLQEIPWRLEAQQAGTLGGFPSTEAVFVGEAQGVSITSKYALVKRGLSVFAFFTASFSEGQELCATDFEAIRKSVVLP